MNARTGPRRRGFTLMEMGLASLLMMVVVILLAHAWSAFGRSALIATARARLAQEANLAAEAIARDVGQLARADGTPSQAGPPSIRADGASLTLRLDDGTGIIREVSYETDPDEPGKLFRAEAGGRRVVAALVADFQVRATSLSSRSDDADVFGYEVELTLSHRVLDRDPDGTFRGDYTRRYTLFIEADPS